MKRFSALLLGGFGAIWVFGIVAAARNILRFETTPGLADAPSSQWPNSTPFARVTNRFTIVMFADPDCSCTRASLSELRKLLFAYPQTARVYVVFEKCRLGQAAANSSLWKSAATLPDTMLVLDEAGEIARQFHVTTSGQTFVYSRDGALSFRGGITSSRGHEGDSDGTKAIGSLLSGQTVSVSATPVYGCALTNSR